MGVPRGTTPTFDLVLTGADLTDAANVYATFKYYGGTITKSGEDLTVSADASGEAPVSTVSVFLNQEETLRFQDGNVEIQVNWTYPDGSRASSEIAKVAFSRQLLGRVIE